MNGQTSIIGTNSVDIRMEKNTAVEGAVIAAQNGNLKLDTGTLTYKDIYDKDSGSNTQVGVSVPLGSAIGSSASAAQGSSTTATTAKNDASSSTAGAGKKASSPLGDFLMGSTLSGSYDSHDKRQVNRATIGEGTIIIRSDPAQGLAGLNRDLQRAQELTKDSQTSVKVYIDPAAIKEVAGGFKGTKESLGKLLDLLEQTLGSRELTPAERRELAGLIVNNKVPKGTPEFARLLYAALSPEEKEYATSKLKELLAASLEGNGSNQRSQLIDAMTLDQRAMVAAAAVRYGVTPETFGLAMDALVTVKIVEKFRNGGFNYETDAGPAQYLPQQVIDYVDRRLSDQFQNVNSDKEVLSSLIDGYKSAKTQSDRSEAIKGLISVISKYMGLGDVTVSIETAKSSTTSNAGSTVAFVSGVRFSNDLKNVTNAGVFNIPAGSLMLQGWSVDEVVVTIGHELTHAQQKYDIANYARGEKGNPLSPLLLVNQALYVQSSQNTGLYRAQPSEAEAEYNGKMILQKIKEAIGVI